MTQPPICSVDAGKLTLSIKGEPHTYSNDKAGKRQAILDGLNAIPTISVGQDTYLSSSEALQLVAAVMYPEGIQTEAAYQTVCQVTEKACNHIGYGGEVQSFGATGRCLCPARCLSPAVSAGRCPNWCAIN